MKTALSVIAMALLAMGCSSQEIQRKDGNRSMRDFSVVNLAKAEADVLAEISQREAMRSLRLLTEKLYRRNPQEYRKTGLDSPEQATQAVFDTLAAGGEHPDWEAGFRLALAEDYAGDRVHAFMGALTRMVMAAYENKREFFLPDELSAQKLYNSARNVEVAVWKLSQARLPDGRPALVTNSIESDLRNLSFEREFGKVIAIQDTLALFIEDRTNRSISRVFQNVASVAFLPV